MDDNSEDLATAVSLALSQAKRVQRESRKVVQQLGAVQALLTEEHPTAYGHKETHEHRRED